jgi:hypothetical protein
MPRIELGSASRPSCRIDTERKMTTTLAPATSPRNDRGESIMPFEDNLSGAADFVTTLSLADTPTYVELTDGTAGLVLEVTVSPTGPAILRILVTSLSDDRDPEIEYEEKSNSPTQTYATANLSKVALAKRPPNG